MWIEDSDVALNRCIFDSNEARRAAAGGGMYISNSDVTLRHCEFIGNVNADARDIYASSSNVDLFGTTFSSGEKQIWAGNTVVTVHSTCDPGASPAQGEEFEFNDGTSTLIGEQFSLSSRSSARSRAASSTGVTGAS